AHTTAVLLPVWSLVTPIQIPAPPSAFLPPLSNGEPWGGWLFSRHDHIDAVVGAQAVIGDPQQAVRIRRQIYAHDVRLLVGHEVHEARVLVAEAIVVLPPDM